MRPARGARWAVLLLLLAFGTTLAEVGWWTVYNLRNVRDGARAERQAWARDASLARDLLALPAADSRDIHDPARLQRQLAPYFAHLQLLPSGAVQVAPEKEAQLQQKVRARVRMFVAEGSFFVAMMLLGGTLLFRALRAQMRAMQQGENFLAAVTHELKSPLASMRLWVETLQRRQLAPPAQQRTFGMILHDIDRLETLVGNVLTASRLDAAAQQPAATSPAQDLDLVAATQAVVASFRPRAEAKGVTLRLETPTALAAAVAGGAWRVVVANLLDNAIKYGGHAVTVRLAAEPTARGLHLVVTDDGLGLAAAELARIFDKFYRVGNEMVRASEGCGLGLYLVRAVVQELGGEVRAHSAGIGRGATFAVHLPHGPPTRAPAAAHALGARPGNAVARVSWGAP